MVRIPRTDYHPEAGLAKLTEPESRQTTIVGFTLALPHVLLAEDGMIFVSEGYIYDYASGPAINNPAMVYASLIHDAFYDLLKRGRLPQDQRKRADKLFRNMLLEAGASPIRAGYAYLAVRVFGRSSAAQAAKV